MTKSAFIAAILGLGMSLAAPAMAYGVREVTADHFPRDVGREAFQPPVHGTPLPMRPDVRGQAQLPVNMPGWAHDGTDMMSNGQAAYPVLTQTAMDHPPSGLDHGTLLTEQFQGPHETATTFAGHNDMAFDG